MVMLVIWHASHSLWRHCNDSLNKKYIGGRIREFTPHMQWSQWNPHVTITELKEVVTSIHRPHLANYIHPSLLEVATTSRRRYDMDLLSTILALLKENTPITGGFPWQRASNKEF